MARLRETLWANFTIELAVGSLVNTLLHLILHNGRSAVGIKVGAMGAWLRLGFHDLEEIRREHCDAVFVFRGRVECSFAKGLARFCRSWLPVSSSDGWYGAQRWANNA